VVEHDNYDQRTKNARLVRAVRRRAGQPLDRLPVGRPQAQRVGGTPPDDICRPTGTDNSRLQQSVRARATATSHSRRVAEVYSEGCSFIPGFLGLNSLLLSVNVQTNRHNLSSVNFTSISF